ncbi:MAG: VWA domain-containing protein [Flavobacteriales bacterium]|nr:VWA domain-containing protein [Flavobacteriales bacterium]
MNRERWVILIAALVGLLLPLLLWTSFRHAFEYEWSGAFYLLFLALPFSGFFAWRGWKGATSVKYSSLEGFDEIPESWLGYARHALHLVRMAVFALLILALARPQSATSHENLTREGIDIVLAMDLSASMLSKDFKPNRLDNSKEVAAEFVAERPYDRVGLVVYEGESFTEVPLTTDHRVVLEKLSQLRSGLVEGGTAIGMGLATAVSRLKNSEAKSKVIILLTDGVNNRGTIQPIDAARIAEAFGIRVYTIGVGSRGEAPTPVAIRPDGSYVYELRPVEIDEEVLEEIAKMTGGAYFRATSKEKLENIYDEIDTLEKTKFNVTQYQQHTEEFKPFLWWAIVLLLIDFGLQQTLFRSTP